MKKKTVAALALSAVLAMGTVPAFAVEGAGGETPVEPTPPAGSVSDLPQNTTDIKEGGTTGTTVKVQTVIDNISVKLPLNMTIVASAAGGAASCPSDEKYLIENHSIFPIKITSAKAEAQGDKDWDLKPGSLDASTTTDCKVGALAIKLTTTDAAKASWDVGASNGYTADSFKIPAAVVNGEGVTVGQLKFKVEASSSKLKQTYDKATDAVKLTYTVAADSKTVTPAP